MNAIPPAALSFVFWGGKTTTLPTHQNHGSVGANTATQTLTLLDFPMYEIGLLRATYNSQDILKTSLTLPHSLDKLA